MFVTIEECLLQGKKKKKNRVTFWKTICYSQDYF